MIEQRSNRRIRHSVLCDAQQAFECLRRVVMILVFFSFTKKWTVAFFWQPAVFQRFFFRSGLVFVWFTRRLRFDQWGRNGLTDDWWPFCIPSRSSHLLVPWYSFATEGRWLMSKFCLF